MFNKNDAENSFIIFSMFFGVGTISLTFNICSACFYSLKKKKNKKTARYLTSFSALSQSAWCFELLPQCLLELLLQIKKSLKLG